MVIVEIAAAVCEVLLVRRQRFCRMMLLMVQRGHIIACVVVYGIISTTQVLQSRSRCVRTLRVHVLAIASVCHLAACRTDHIVVV